ncbi:hypothetical protein GCM10010116_39190 [Microbispora rosea subsp. aerata]|nr:hypothetical protein [Microbispora rosea]GGO19508.1 hypothetical protein GCM10010116_39190 [Microbispora rosea subsp. aerata]GIH54400.1 hypothetical protein Mro02_13140 [Microbispora rosea subsp. aerata]GLJ81372.1 hypothetical protein GCM10017588_00950 [Microbispora rosea subsp. aerata]
MAAEAGAPGRGRAPQRNQEWVLTLLPAFPLVLLVMRLWYASRQDTQTLLLLVQYVSPLGLLTTVLLTLVWVLPAVVLAGRMLGPLYRLSTRRSVWVARAADRVPDWVVGVAVAMGLLGWQLRFLPTLLMLTLVVVGLTLRERRPLNRTAIRAVCLVLPVACGVLVLLVLRPAIMQALEQADVSTLLLLTVPPVLGPLVTGPVPARAAPLVVHGLTWTLMVLFPLVAGAVVLRSPILPLVAVEIAAEPDGKAEQVTVGYVIASDDRLVTILERSGAVRFIRNDLLVSQVLCPEPSAVPYTTVNLHGWNVEQSALSWLAPAPVATSLDSRCEGRPATPADLTHDEAAVSASAPKERAQSARQP